MIDCLATLLLALGLSIAVEYGHAVYYAEGVMEEVVYVRQHTDKVWATLPKEVPPVIGFVALNDCNEIGDLVWLWHESPPELAGPYWVVDCRAPQDVAEADRKGIVVEVDYNTATRWGIVGFGPQYINAAVIRSNLKE